jgi:hypothetical protein
MLLRKLGKGTALKVFRDGSHSFALPELVDAPIEFFVQQGNVSMSSCCGKIL